MRALFGIFVTVFLAVGSSAQKSQIYTEKNYTVYNNTNSCELYADYSDDSLLRISFNGATDTVNLTYYSEKWSRMLVQDTFTITLATDDDPKNMVGGVAMIVDKGDMKGIHHTGGEELLTLLQGANALRIDGPHLIPLSHLDVSGMDLSMKRLKICGNQKTR